ncbi:MAG: PilZ domain-containing protein [Nitrospirae bacterium]|nr:MAG: PilZ domain-containing protein [Nitrospirota bacterium]
MIRLNTTCPQCGKDFIHRVGRRGWREQWLGLFCVNPFRCQICMQRFLVLQPGHWHVSSVRERRESERFPVKFFTSLTGDQAQETGTMVNLGVQGGCCQSEAGLTIGTVFRLNIHPEEGAPAIEIESAVVQWSLGTWHGLEFRQVAPEQEQRLRQLMEACWAIARGEARSGSR